MGVRRGESAVLQLCKHVDDFCLRLVCHIATLTEMASQQEPNRGEDEKLSLGRGT